MTPQAFGDRQDVRWVATLPAEVLSHLAAIARDLERPRFYDPEAAADEVVAMLVAGTRPALGWWRRHIARAGMSTRAIGAATGVSVGTVHSDLAGVQNRTPDPDDEQDPDALPDNERRVTGVTA